MRSRDRQPRLAPLRLLQRGPQFPTRLGSHERLRLVRGRHVHLDAQAVPLAEGGAEALLVVAVEAAGSGGGAHDRAGLREGRMICELRERREIEAFGSVLLQHLLQGFLPPDAGQIVAACHPRYLHDGGAAR